MLLALALGCRETRLSISVTIPDATGAPSPAAGVTVVALPYDRDSLMASLENAAPSPRPHTAALDSLFQLFRLPFAESTRLAALANRLRDTLRVAAPDPTQADRAARLRDSLTVLQRAQAEASARLDLVRARVAPMIDSLRVEVRAWQERTYADWPDLTRSLTSGRLVAGITDTTGHDGHARLYLPPGRRHWWVYARSFNSGDPNSEWYWNVPVTGGDIVLDTSTGRLRPRY